MAFKTLYHGANGDNILAIIRESQIKPGSDGTIYFSESRYESVLMHGADTKRKATFAIKLQVDIPDSATLERKATPGVSDTLVVKTKIPLKAQVVELYVREPRETTIKTIRGEAAIQAFLNGR